MVARDCRGDSGGATAVTQVVRGGREDHSVAGRAMSSSWIWEIDFDTRLKGFPEGLDLDTKERMMMADDLWGSGLSIGKDLGANKWIKEDCGWSRLNGEEGHKFC